MKKLLLLLLLSTTCCAGTYLPGTIFSPVVGKTVAEAQITNNGATCTVAYNPGGWVASATRISAGRCDVDITGFFTATPVCIMSCSGGYWGFFFNGTLTNTTNTIECRDVSNTATDATIDLICYGAK